MKKDIQCKIYWKLSITILYILRGVERGAYSHRQTKIGVQFKVEPGDPTGSGGGGLKIVA